MTDVVRIYADTCVYLDLLTRNSDIGPDGEPWWRTAKALFDAVLDGRVELAASALIDAEVCCSRAVRDEDASNIVLVREWFNAPSTHWTDVDTFLGREAGRLSKAWNQHRFDPKKHLGGADATHLAAAVRLECDYLMTRDGGFPLGQDVSGVKVREPGIVWQQHLGDVDTDD